MSETHYLPPFGATRRDGAQLTICGRFVQPTDHSTEPSCPACARELFEEDETAAALMREFPEYRGKL